MEPADIKQRVPLHLARPVDDHARRADDQEVRRALGRQVTHRGERLHRLAQAHLVAKDHSLLDQGELRAERLVAAQRCLQEGLVKGQYANLLGDVRGEEALTGIPGRAEFRDLDEQAVVGDGAGEVIVPQPGDPLFLAGFFQLGFCPGQPLACRGDRLGGEDGIQPGEGITGFLLLLPGKREEHSPPTRAAGRRVEAAPDLARQRTQVRALQRGPGSLVTAQRGDERGLPGGPGIRVDADASGFLDGLPQLRGGGHDPLRRPAANPRDSPDLSRSRREDLADRFQARIYEGGERDLLLYEVPKAVHRHRVQRVGDNPVAHRLIRLSRDLAGLPRRGQDRLNRVADRAAVGDDGAGCLPRAKRLCLDGLVLGQLRVPRRFCRARHRGETLRIRTDDRTDYDDRGYRRYTG